MTALVSIFCLHPSCLWVLLDDSNSIAHAKGLAPIAGVCVLVSLRGGQCPLFLQLGCLRGSSLPCSSVWCNLFLAVLPGAEQATALSTLLVTQAEFPGGVPEGS